MKLNSLFCIYLSQMQNNYFQWQFRVWHKTTFGIINHSKQLFWFLNRKNSTVFLEPLEVLTTIYVQKNFTFETKSVLHNYFYRIFTKEKSKDVWIWAKKYKIYQKEVKWIPLIGKPFKRSKSHLKILRLILWGFYI